jgi:hypothetical protein
VSLVAAFAVFLGPLIEGPLRHDSVNGHTLTPLEQLPTALLLSVTAAGLALLGTWLGLRRVNIQRFPYHAGLAVAFLYVVATLLAGSLTHSAPRTVTFPSHEANILGLEVLVIGVLWGIGAPYLIALLLRRFYGA